MLLVVLPFLLFIAETSQVLVWEELVPVEGSLSPRRYAAIGYRAAENAIYIFGGLSATEQPLNDMSKFDLTTRRWKPVSPITPNVVQVRFGAVFGSRGNYFYVATGEGVDASKNSRTYFNDLWRFDFTAKAWHELTSSLKPKHRYSAAGGIHDDDSGFLLSHGFGDDDVFSNSFSYDTDKSSSGWEEIFGGTNNYDPRYPHARKNQASTMISRHKLLIFGGCLSGQGTGGPCPSDDSWIFDKASKEWKELNRCSSPKTSAAMARLPKDNSTAERVVLWGGEADSRTTLATDDDKEDEVAIFKMDEEEWVIKKTQAKANVYPASRAGHVMVTTKDGIVMFGGKRLSDDKLLSDVWLLRGSSSDADPSADGRNCGRQYFNLIMLHGIFMFIGWSVFLIMGVFAARYFRFLQPLWFRLHVVFQILGAVFVLAGTICGIVSVPAHEHFKFAHSIFGYVIFMMVVQQPFNAMLRPPPMEQGSSCSRTCWEKWHKWSGRLVLLCGIVNTTLGLFLAVAPSLVWALWLAYVGLWVVIFVISEIVKRPFEKELRRRAKKPMVYDTSNPYRITRGQTNTAF